MSEEVKQDVGSLSYQDQLFKLQQDKNKIATKEYELISKGLQSNNPDEIIKANTYWQDVQNQIESGSKTTLIDPNEWTQGNGFKHKRFNLDYNVMRRMVDTTPIISSIISTRQTQVSSFSNPQSRKYETGFIVRRKPEFYTDEKPTVSSQDKKTIDKLTRFLINGGEEENSWNGDNFDTFLQKLVADSLTLDQSCFEVIRNLGGAPIEFLAVDGATIRIADTMFKKDVDLYNYQGRLMKKQRGYLPSYVQVMNDMITAEYYPWELCFGVRNATTDVRANGYGKSEIERLISIITWMLYGDSYNGKFFSQGSNPKGMLKVGQGANTNRLAQFKQQWLSMVAGVQNAWKVPILEGDIEWIDLQKGNRDMEFSQWQQYLIKVSCAVYKIAPEELGFSGKSNNGNSLFEGSEQVRLDYSKDKGLKPLLKSLEFWINKWIITPLDADFEFKFVGLDQDDEDKELERLNKKVQHGMGFKEWREAQGMDRDLPEDDFPLNQVYMQHMQQQMFGDQQEESGDAVQDNVELWDSLDQDGIDKALVQDNPMMKELLK